MNDVYGFNVIANGRNWNSIKLITHNAQLWTEHKLTGINFKFQDNGVYIVVTKESPKGPQVAFVEGNSLDDALFVLAASIKSKTLRWKSDKYRSIRKDKTKS